MPTKEQKAGYKRKWAQRHRMYEKFRSLNNGSKRLGYAPLACTKEEFFLWFQQQSELCQGRCQCCNALFGSREPHVDHDHETGRLRGLLCRRCNHIEGHRSRLSFVQMYVTKHYPEQFVDGGGI